MAVLYTIGFTQTGARAFFSSLRQAGVRVLIDTRLNNKSQLAGFAKQADLDYFTRELLGAQYRHEPLLAPTRELLGDYRQGKSGWEAYAGKYLDLIAARRIERAFSRADLDGACLLCSEHLPHHCHRRLAAEYLQSHGRALEVRHLVP
jgi:uncharacterized protein (DUF488 family)